MGSEVDERFRDTVKSFKELLLAVKKMADDEMRKTAPSVASSLDKSFEAASSAFLDAIETIDNKTQQEQRELLKAYSSFLQKQDELVRKRLAAVERGVVTDGENSNKQAL
jgi:signal transduction protein with GAF and PtsI domain